MLSKNKALVVFSGGQDSTTCLFWAKKHFEEVHAICFRYGQKHEQEVVYAQRIAERADVPFTVLDLSFISQLAVNCSLTNQAITMDRDKPADTPPNTFVPGRNLFFLSVAAVYAREHDIMNIVTGVSQTDFSGYPDCRDSFVRSLNVSLNLAMERQGRDMATGRPTRHLRPRTPRHHHLLQRHTRRRMRWMPRMQTPQTRAGNISQL